MKYILIIILFLNSLSTIAQNQDILEAIELRDIQKERLLSNDPDSKIDTIEYIESLSYDFEVFEGKTLEAFIKYIALGFKYDILLNSRQPFEVSKLLLRYHHHAVLEIHLNSSINILNKKIDLADFLELKTKNIEVHIWRFKEESFQKEFIVEP